MISLKREINFMNIYLNNDGQVADDLPVVLLKYSYFVVFFSCSLQALKQNKKKKTKSVPYISKLKTLKFRYIT